MSKDHPCTLWTLAGNDGPPHDTAYARGARFMVEDFQGQNFYFRTMEDVATFSHLHGISVIPAEKMKALREGQGGEAS